METATEEGQIVSAQQLEQLGWKIIKDCGSWAVFGNATKRMIADSQRRIFKKRRFRVELIVDAI